MKKKTTTVKSRPVAKKPVTKYSPALLPKADRFNEGKEKWGLVHFGSLKPMVRVLEFGADKYSEDNWKKGLDKKGFWKAACATLQP
ncbi:MAG: dATP/dGTP diphosphohydrolase domain-containing protein [Chitinophagales bacterium]